MRYLTADQVNAFHKMVHFLRRLRILGLLTTKTEQAYITDFGKPHRYHLTLESYDETMKGKLTPMEALEMLSIFSQDLGLYDDDGGE